MGFNRDDVVLAELDMPSESAVNAQLDDLLQPGGERVEPAAESVEIIAKLNVNSMTGLVMDTLGNIRDAKSLAVGSRLPGGQWPQAVNL
ncbi:hypothetical protein H4696_009744 [Amycolatopsis lexingtonensis]|uniref:Uncharacterized protein n=1 Tax=Amycolatopsis lexingtonensis TaxID=218822 RepID=A0ABR9IHI5_9PSEU|nr:hypothetical protein [Amycolatopsis lexingtonensis]MBE1502644.1 hypothetical protein [Amycolatopsis lexingtonensis]